jgi:hypothetical protein
MIKSRMTWDLLVAYAYMNEIITAYRTLSRKPGGKKRLGRLSCGWNIILK